MNPLTCTNRCFSTDESPNQTQPLRRLYAFLRAKHHTSVQGMKGRDKRKRRLRRWTVVEEGNAEEKDSRHVLHNQATFTV